MSTTSSVETPTSPSATAASHHYNHHNHHHPHQHTTTAIVASAGAAHHHNNTNQFNRHRSHSSSSSSNNSFTAATGINSKKVSATPHIHNSGSGSGSGNGNGNGNNYNHNSSTQNSGGGNIHNQATHSPLTPSSSTSSSPSVSASASISAAVHHPHSHQQQQQHYSYLHRSTARPSTCLSDPDGVVAATSSNMKRHADVSVCSSGSSSSCCSSTGSVSAVGVISASNPATNIAVVTPSVVTSSSGAVITQKLSRTIPSDKINLRLILVSGKTKEFLFNPSDSAGDIAQTVFDNWPEDWEREAVSKAEILRLIYQGRFLHCNVTLGALGLPMGKTTVMHLVPRDNLPEPNSQDQRQKSKGGSSRCCSTTCCIL